MMRRGTNLSAQEAAERGRKVTASDANLRASIYYHYAKHLFAHNPDQYFAAHQRVVQCYQAAGTMFDPPLERIEIPFAGATMIGNLRRPRSVQHPAVAILLPGLDACKEELHAWSEAFVRRGLATLAIDGPGQGETAFKLPITTEWGKSSGPFSMYLSNGPMLTDITLR